MRVKLRHLEKWIEARRTHVQRYSELLEGCNVVTPYEMPDVRHVYHLYVVRTPRRDELLTCLKQQGIGAGIHYPIPVHRQPAYSKQGYGDPALPIAEQAANEVLSLPMYPELGEKQLALVTQVLREMTRQS